MPDWRICDPDSRGFSVTSFFQASCSHSELWVFLASLFRIIRHSWASLGTFLPLFALAQMARHHWRSNSICSLSPSERGCPIRSRADQGRRSRPCQRARHLRAFPSFYSRRSDIASLASVDSILYRHICQSEVRGADHQVLTTSQRIWIPTFAEVSALWVWAFKQAIDSGRRWC